jgi:hypothetical protein
MMSSFTNRLARIGIDKRSVPVGVVTVAAAIAPLVLPLRPALVVSGVIVLFLVLLASREAVAVRRLHRDVAAKRVATDLLRGSAEPRRADRSKGEVRRIERIQEAVAGGFPDSAAEEVRTVACNAGIPVATRLQLLQSLLDWQVDGDPVSSKPKRSAFDVVFISPFGMQGGTTSANVAEIRVCRDQGLKVGLLHHPIYKWGRNAPLNPRIKELVDDKSVRLIGLDDEVECDLALVRLPTALMKPLERRPRITAGRTAVLVNQTPFKFYGAEGPREEAWDIATVERHITEWLGPHTWFAGGPQVRATLLEHHASEFARLDLADSLWNETIAIDEWRLDGRRKPDGRIRIGRHSRDHELKWPEDRETLLHCYPDREPFEIHVLGGAATPAGICGRLPSNWTVHPFNALSARDFLSQIDLMAYFISSDGLEAFGRAPLEAMAAGVPVVMDPRFQPTFGPAAVYCEPEEVASVAERLMSDPDAYAAQQAAARAYLADHFSGRELMERLSQCAEHLQGPSTSVSDRFRGIRQSGGVDPTAESPANEGAYKARYVGDLLQEPEVGSLVD